MKYDEIEIGQKATISHVITDEDVKRFIELTGDNNILHIMENPVVHGMLTASFISTLIGTRLPGDGSLWFKQTLYFLYPVRIGDTITINGEVTVKKDKEKHIMMGIDIHNQNGMTVVAGTSWIKLLE
jgi:3-oxoacyl-[acyl-carrier protein] reductase